MQGKAFTGACQLGSVSLRSGLAGHFGLVVEAHFALPASGEGLGLGFGVAHLSPSPLAERGKREKSRYFRTLG